MRIILKQRHQAGALGVIPPLDREKRSARSREREDTRPGILLLKVVYVYVNILLTFTLDMQMEGITTSLM
jgi:hypothetical protein